MRNALFFALLLSGMAQSFGAEVYPIRPIRMVVPAPPGGGADFIARLILQPLTEQLGNTVIVDNRGGAAGRIGTELVAKSAPTGYTFLLGERGFTINPGMFKSLPYDSIKDFTPISHFVRDPDVLAVPSSLKVNTLKDFIALAQANSGKYHYGSAGPGSPSNLGAELFKTAAKVNVVHVPYKGGGEMITAVLSGETQMMLNSAPNVLPHVKSGQLRALAVSTAGTKRLRVLPDVPSFNEAGVPGMTIYAWNGLIGPAGMPKDVVSKLHIAFVKALASPVVKERYIALGGESDLEGTTPEEFSAYIRNEIRRWTEIIQSAGITPE